MSLEFEVGDAPHCFGPFVIMGLSSSSLTESDKRLLGTLKPAGILLQKRNFNHALPYADWIAELSTLESQLKNYLEREEVLISIEHEGGKNQRVPKPITEFPDATHCAKKVGAVAKAMGIELKSLGVNVSWSPVCDINSKIENPVIGTRAFGTSSDEVVDAAVTFLNELQGQGVAGCAKHFPGLGETSTDSQLELPVLNLTTEDLENRELRPFRAIIEAGVELIMTAHVLYPRIDKLYPATFSEKILAGLLRDKLNFKGVVISDNIEMKSVSKGFDDSENLGIAMNAGCDMFMVARAEDPDSMRPLALANLFARSLRSRKLSEYTLHATFERVAGLFKKLPQNKAVCLSEDTLEEHAELARSLEPKSLAKNWVSG